MVRKKERLSREAFNRFFSMGRRFHTPYGTVVYAPHPSFHCAVVVSKKAARLAVARNRVRRRVYEIMRRSRERGSYTGVYIVLVKTSACTASYAELSQVLLEVVTKTQKVR